MAVGTGGFGDVKCVVCNADERAGGMDQTVLEQIPMPFEGMLTPFAIGASGGSSTSAEYPWPSRSWTRHRSGPARTVGRDILGTGWSFHVR